MGTGINLKHIRRFDKIARCSQMSANTLCWCRFPLCWFWMVLVQRLNLSHKLLINDEHSSNFNRQIILSQNQTLFNEFQDEMGGWMGVVHDDHPMSPSQLERLFQEMVLCAEAVTSKEIHKTALPSINFLLKECFWKLCWVPAEVNDQVASAQPPSKLLICSSFSRKNGNLLHIFSSLSTNQSWRLWFQQILPPASHHKYHVDHPLSGWILMKKWP